MNGYRLNDRERIQRRIEENMNGLEARLRAKEVKAREVGIIPLKELRLALPQLEQLIEDISALRAEQKSMHLRLDELVSRLKEESDAR